MLLFLQKARKVIETGERDDFRSLIEDMRGLSHYFCSYCKDTKTLDTLLDELFSDVQNASKG